MSDRPCKAASIFLTEEWFDLFQEHVVADNEVVKLIPSENIAKGCQIILPVRAPSTLIFFPRTWHSLSNYYSGVFEPIIKNHQPCQSECVDGLIATLINTPGWDQLKLEPYNNNNPLWEQIKSKLKKSNFHTQEYFCHGNWYMHAEGRSFAEYFNSRPGRVKATIKRKFGKFASISGAHIDIITSPNQVGLAMDSYETIYSKSWKTPESHPAFIRSFVNKAAEQGWLRMGVACIGKTPIAAQIWFVFDGTASIFKLAYDEQYKKLSIGTLITARLFEHVLDIDHVEEIDYLSGDDAYKKEWMELRRERLGVLIFNRNTLRGWLMAARHIGGRKIKQLIHENRRS